MSLNLLAFIILSYNYMKEKFILLLAILLSIAKRAYKILPNSIHGNNIFSLDLPSS